MSTTPIVLVHPQSASGAALDDAALLALYGTADRRATLVRANFIASVDGAATASGLSGDLGTPADKRVFDLLRRLCDVVLVGAGTVRNEGYGAMRLDPAAVEWRVAEGLAEHPVFAIVSSSLALDPASDVFAKAPVRPVVITIGNADPARRRALEAVADVVICGDAVVDPGRMIAALVERGLAQVLCEGGPTLFGDLVEADALDELCLSVSPVLEGGAAERISRTRRPDGVQAALQAMTLDHVLVAGDLLLTKYSRIR